MKKIGFIGQGYVGKSYADNFEERGFSVVRYSIEPQYSGNKKMIKDCDLVFIAVPTPTTNNVHDISIVRDALKLLSPGTVAVIKSTVLPGTTSALQNTYKKITVFHSPEFLTSATAKADVDRPLRNIVGISIDNPEYRAKAKEVLALLPHAPYELVCSSTESEFIKYVGNTFYYAKTVYMNVLYDLAQKIGADWKNVKPALAADPWIGPMHIDPLHKTGRGAGGHCLLKDFAALKNLYTKTLPKNKTNIDLLKQIEKINLSFLEMTNKDLHIVKTVYGKASNKKKK